MPEEGVTTSSAWASPLYRHYAMSNGVSLIGTWVQRLSLAWLAWKLSGSELWVGVIAFSTFAPLVLSPLFGALSDRLSARSVALATNGAMLLIAAVIGLLSAGNLLDIHVLLGLALVIGVANAAYVPVRMAIVHELVPKAQVTNAVANNSLIFNVSRLVGPIVAGVLLAKASIEVCFLLNGLSFLPFMWVLSRIPARKAEAKPGRQIMGEVCEGFVYTARQTLLRRQIMLSAWGGIFTGGVLEMVAVYADKLFGRGVDGLAHLSVASGAGALVAAFACARLKLDLYGREHVVNVTRIVAAICMSIFALLPNLWVGMAILAVMGGSTTASSVLSQTMVQTEGAPAYRGRVSAIWGMFAMGSMALGGLMLGAAMEFAGLKWATLGLGLAGIILPAVFLYQAKTRAFASH